jgi:D-alanyl-D-alanine carboxypeptidase (penicillin-binding protein 5/6)
MGRRLVLLLCATLALAWAPARAIAYSPSAQSWVVIDGGSGDVLAAHDADVPLYPASLTKMLTAQVVLDHAGLQEKVRISRAAATAPADHLSWPEGATFTVEQVLHGMILESSNGAAIALAEHVAGSEWAFAALMNNKARFLGATKSFWTNPDGLDAEGQLATARDLALIARAFMSHPVLARIAAARSYAVPWRGGRLVLHSRNNFLTHYPGAVGVKPGYTSHALNCLAAAAVRKNRMLIAVVMHSSSSTADASRLLDTAFARPKPRGRPMFKLPSFPIKLPETEPVDQVAGSPAESNAQPGLTDPTVTAGAGRVVPASAGAYALVSMFATLGVLRVALRRKSS